LADRAIATGNPVEVGELDDPQPAILRLPVTATSRMPWWMRTSPAATVTATRSLISRQGTVVVRIDLDSTIVADDAGQFARRSERRRAASTGVPRHTQSE
jgi:hypothetical protein